MNTKTRLFPDGSAHLGFDIDAPSKAALERIAARRGMTLAQMMRVVVRTYLHELGMEPVREGEK